MFILILYTFRAHGCTKYVENWNKHIRKRIVRQVGYLQELYRDVRSAKHKILLFSSWSNAALICTGLGSSVPCPQEYITGQYWQTVDTSLHHHLSFFKIHYIITLPFTYRCSMWSVPYNTPDQNITFISYILMPLMPTFPAYVIHLDFITLWI